MRKLAFVVSLLGIFILLSISLVLPATHLNSPFDLNKTINNQRVFVSGTVIQETFSGRLSILKLNNSLSLHCDCKSLSFKNKNISVLGVINEFPPGNKYIKVLKIKEKK